MHVASDMLARAGLFDRYSDTPGIASKPKTKAIIPTTACKKVLSALIDGFDLSNILSPPAFKKVNYYCYNFSNPIV